MQVVGISAKEIIRPPPWHRRLWTSCRGPQFHDVKIIFDLCTNIQAKDLSYPTKYTGSCIHGLPIMVVLEKAKLVSSSTQLVYFWHN